MKKIKINSVRFLILSILILGTSGVVLWNVLSRNQVADRDSEILIKKQYVCSMHPQVIQNKPGDCPLCGMALIEKIEHDNNAADSMLKDVVLSVNQSVLGSSATVSPVFEELLVTIDAPGIITFDSRKIRTVSARFAGLIERSFVKHQFQPVRKGEKIFEIYCPDIYTERWNYVKLIQMYPDRDDLTVEAREWLSLLGHTTGQIDSLKKAIKPNYHLPVYSESDGFAVSPDFDPETYSLSAKGSESEFPAAVSERKNLGFNDGVTVETGAVLFKMVDAVGLRADLKIKTEDARYLKKGQKVLLTTIPSSLKKIETVVNTVEPLNGSLFQLVRAYTTDNNGLFFPGRQVNARIIVGNHKALWVPKTSVINLGKRQYVFVMQDNKFVAAPVKTGLISGEKIEIVSGIGENSTIALKASLLTDSDGFIGSGNRNL